MREVYESILVLIFREFNNDLWQRESHDFSSHVYGLCVSICLHNMSSIGYLRNPVDEGPKKKE